MSEPVSALLPLGNFLNDLGPELKGLIVEARGVVSDVREITTDVKATVKTVREFVESNLGSQVVSAGAVAGPFARFDGSRIKAMLALLNKLKGRISEEEFAALSAQFFATLAAPSPMAWAAFAFSCLKAAASAENVSLADDDEPLLG